MLATVQEKVTTYKESCDEVLLSRGKKNVNRTVVKAENGSSFYFLKNLQNKKKRIEI